MNKQNRQVLGVLLLLFGAMFLLDRLDLLPFSLFFTGWWAFLLIVPAILSMSRQGVSLGNVILLCLGVFLFLDTNGWNLSKFVLPGILILAGISMLFNKR